MFAHATCLLDFYRRANKATLGKSYSEDERRYYGIALSQLVSYMVEAAEADENVVIFKLSDLTKMYAKFLTEFGLKIEGRIHSTRLKNRLLAQFEDLREQREGKEVILAFSNDIGGALHDAASINYNKEGAILAEADKIIRRDIFRQENPELTAT